jgi:predicted nucleic acid-binding protein
MTVYLLDANTVSHLADRTSAFHEPAKRRLASVPEESEVAASILTLHELTYGFAYHPASSRVLSTVQEGQVRILPRTLAELEPRLAIENWVAA